MIEKLSTQLNITHTAEQRLETLVKKINELIEQVNKFPEDIKETLLYVEQIEDRLMRGLQGELMSRNSKRFDPYKE